MGFIFIGVALVLFFLIFKEQLSGSSSVSGKASIAESPSDYCTRTGEPNTCLNVKIEKYGLNKYLVRSLVIVESNGDTKAFNPAGPSYGLMQITPILAQTYGLIKDARNVSANDIALMMDIRNNAEIGCWFFAYLLGKYKQNVAIQMYTLGEAGYNSGKRATNYLEKVLYWFKIYNTMDWDHHQELHIH